MLASRWMRLSWITSCWLRALAVPLPRLCACSRVFMHTKSRPTATDVYNSILLLRRPPCLIACCLLVGPRLQMKPCRATRPPAPSCSILPFTSTLALEALLTWFLAQQNIVIPEFTIRDFRLSFEASRTLQELSEVSRVPVSSSASTSKVPTTPTNTTTTSLIATIIIPALCMSTREHDRRRFLGRINVMALGGRETRPLRPEPLIGLTLANARTAARLVSALPGTDSQQSFSKIKRPVYSSSGAPPAPSLVLDIAFSLEHCVRSRPCTACPTS